MLMYFNERGGSVEVTRQQFPRSRRWHAHEKQIKRIFFFPFCLRFYYDWRPAVIPKAHRTDISAGGRRRRRRRRVFFVVSLTKTSERVRGACESKSGGKVLDFRASSSGALNGNRDRGREFTARPVCRVARGNLQSSRLGVFYLDSNSVLFITYIFLFFSFVSFHTNLK